MVITDFRPTPNLKPAGGSGPFVCCIVGSAVLVLGIAGTLDFLGWPKIALGLAGCGFAATVVGAAAYVHALCRRNDQRRAAVEKAAAADAARAAQSLAAMEASNAQRLSEIWALERERNELESLLDAAEAPAVVMGADGAARFANRAARALLAVSPEAIRAAERAAKCVAAFLGRIHHDGNANLGIICREKSYERDDEPVVRIFSIHDFLRRAGLAGDDVICDRGERRRAVLAHDGFQRLDQA